MPVVLAFRDVCYPNCLDGFSCEIESGASVLVLVSRDDQASALLHLITGMSRPSRGSVLIDGHDIFGLAPAQRHQIRRQIGVIPSDGGLISNLKLWENVTLPLIYHNGRVSAEEEKGALDYLARLGYSGSVMALPAHLTLNEHRVAALIRAVLIQPRIMLFGNCIEGSPSASRSAFLQVAQEFHSAGNDRVSLYITSSPGLADELPVDMTIRMDKSVETASREI